MVSEYRVIGTVDLEAFHSEVSSDIELRQPYLTAKIEKAHIQLGGPFVCYGPKGPFDAFDVEIDVGIGFPILEPIVREISGRIPREIDRHMFNSDRCCLGIWSHWLWQNPEASFDKFICGPVHDFFVSQSWFELHQKWPFGERAHGFRGQAEAFLEIMNLPTGANAAAAIRLLGVRKLKGHHLCPCESGSRLRDCHFEKFSMMRDSLDPLIVVAMQRAEKHNRRKPERKLKRGAL